MSPRSGQDTAAGIKQSKISREEVPRIYCRLIPAWSHRCARILFQQYQRNLVDKNFNTGPARMGLAFIIHRTADYRSKECVGHFVILVKALCSKARREMKMYAKLTNVVSSQFLNYVGYSSRPQGKGESAWRQISMPSPFSEGVAALLWLGYAYFPLIWSKVEYKVTVLTCLLRRRQRLQNMAPLARLPPRDTSTTLPGYKDSTAGSAPGSCAVYSPTVLQWSFMIWHWPLWRLGYPSCPDNIHRSNRPQGRINKSLRVLVPTTTRAIIAMIQARQKLDPSLYSKYAPEWL